MVAEIVRSQLAKGSRKLRPQSITITEEDAVVESILTSD